MQGVGPLRAALSYYVLTLEDPQRFSKSRTVGAYSLGLAFRAPTTPASKKIPKKADLQGGR